MIQTGQRSTMNGGEKILGVEGGGTKTAWVLVERAGDELCVLDQGKLPPANLRLATPGELRAIFSELPKEITSAGIFLAGCGTEEDRQSLTRLCAEIWPQAKIVVGSDRDSGLAAALVTLPRSPSTGISSTCSPTSPAPPSWPWRSMREPRASACYEPSLRFSMQAPGAAW